MRSSKKIKILMDVDNSVVNFGEGYMVIKQ